MKKPREWHIQCVGDIGDGSDQIIATGPWTPTKPFEFILVREVFPEESKDKFTDRKQFPVFPDAGKEGAAKKFISILDGMEFSKDYHDGLLDGFHGGWDECLKAKPAKPVRELSILQEQLKVAVEFISHVIEVEEAIVEKARKFLEEKK